MGWLTPLTVTQSGTYVLDAYEFNTSALKTLKSIDPITGARTWYYLEARKPIGFDNSLVYVGMTNGVAIRVGSESSGNTSYMLDMTPNSFANDGLDPNLAAGYSFTDFDAGVAITTDWVTATQAAVTMTVSTNSTSSASTTVKVATDQPSYTGNQTVIITTTVTSGGSPVAGASVTFTIAKSSGAKIVANGITGSNGAAIYKLRLKKQDPVGVYQVDAVAKKDAMSGSAATQFTVK